MRWVPYVVVAALGVLVVILFVIDDRGDW